MSPLGVATSHSTRTLATGETKLWLLLVGVNQYQDERFPSLRYSAVDCQGLATTLSDITGRFSTKAAWVYHDFASQLPTLSTVRDSLRQVTNMAQPEDTILFYFSGHGILEPNSQQAILCLADTQTEDLINTGLSLQELLQCLGNSQAQTQLVWLDACHSGSLTLRGVRSNHSQTPLPNPTPQIVELLRQRAKQSQGFYALLSCDTNQQSWEFPELGHGVFTYYLMRGLRGEAADVRGLIDGDGLYRYVYHQTRQYIEQTNQQLRLINQQNRSRGDTKIYSEYPLQTPKRIVEGVGEVILGVKSALAGSNVDVGICPYRGLRAFKEEDIEYFYGRETITKQLINNLATQSFMAVVGASGSGKSSLVQAGLIAQLRRGQPLLASQDWWIKSFRPGANPLEALSHCLVDNDAEKEKTYQQIQLEEMLYQGAPGLAHWLSHRQESMVLLVVDQFEELFTLSSSEDRQKFLEIVLGALDLAADKWKVVITLRADFIAPCLEIPTLAKLLQQSSVLLSPCLTPIEYRRIIIHPAEQVGLTVESALVEVLLQELHQFPGDLPLLEFVLEQLWEYREHGVITLQAYQQYLGGIKGALEGKAQAIYDSLDSEAQECTQWIFLSLIQLGEGTEDTRQRVLKSELVVKKYPIALVERTLEVLTAAKLVVCTSTPSLTIEIAHDVIISHWSTLRWWLEENRSRLRSHRQIVQATTLWQQNDQQPDFLLQGVSLAEAEEIYLNYIDELSIDVQNFIEASLQERQRQQRQEQSRLRQAQRAVAIISTLGLTAFSLAVFAYQQSQTAQVKEIQALNSLSENFLASHKQLEALMTSVQAGKELEKINSLIPLATRTQTATILQQAVYSIQERNRLLNNALVTSVSFSPDGQIIASGGADNTIHLWDKYGKLLTTLTGHTDAVNSVIFSPDGEILASGSADSTIKLWQLNGRLITTLNGHSRGVNSVTFSPNGKLLAFGSDDSTIQLWSREGQLLLTFNGNSRAINTVTFSPEGDTIAAASDDGTIKLWSLDGRLLTNIPAHTKEVLGVSFSPNGQIIASASADHTVKLWNRNGTLLKTLEGHNGSIGKVVFSPDGQIIATTGADKTIILWSLDGNILGHFFGHSHKVNSLSFSPDGKILASGSDDNTVRLWNIDRILLKSFDGHHSSVNSVRFMSDGRTIASVGADSTIKFWNLEGKLLQTLSSPILNVTSVSITTDGNTVAWATPQHTIQIYNRNGSLLRILPGHKQWITSMSFSPDNHVLASVSVDKIIKVWSLDGRLLTTLSGNDGWITEVKFSPDGKTIVSASADKTLKIWGLDGKLIKTLQGHSATIWGVSFAPNGKIFASASQDKTIKLWSLDGELLHTLQGHNDLVYTLSFSPDSQILASASDDGTIKLWNVDSGTLLKTLQGHRGGVRSVSFSPNGKILVSGGQDATIKLWNLEGIELQTLDLDELLKQGCDRLHNYLTTNPNITTEDHQLCFGE